MKKKQPKKRAQLTFLRAAIADAKIRTPIRRVRASVELYITRALGGSSKIDKGVAVDFEGAGGVAAVGDGVGGGAEGAGEGLEVCGGGLSGEIIVGEGGREGEGREEEGEEEGEGVHFGWGKWGSGAERLGWMDEWMDGWMERRS